MTTITSVITQSNQNYINNDLSDSKFFTTAKIQKIALVAIAILAATTAVFVALFTPMPFKLLAAPLSVITLTFLAFAYKIKDYENPKELLEYKNEAPTLCFKEILNKHKINEIYHYKIISHELLQKKFVESIQDLSSTQIENQFNLTELVKFNLITEKFVKRIKSSTRMLENEALRLNQKYPKFSSQINKHLLDFKENKGFIKTLSKDEKIELANLLLQGPKKDEPELVKKSIAKLEGTEKNQGFGRELLSAMIICSIDI